MAIVDDATILASAPAGSRVVRSPRFTDPLRNLLQTFCALFFASYFFFAPIMAGILLALSYCGLCSNFTIGCITGLYFMQLLLYRPHNYRGWPPLLLYSRLTDFVLHYYDGSTRGCRLNLSCAALQASACGRSMLALSLQALANAVVCRDPGACTRSCRALHVRVLSPRRLRGHPRCYKIPH